MARVQTVSWSQDAGSSPQTSPAFGASTTSGNTIVVLAFTAGTGITSLTDSKSNTYSKAVEQHGVFSSENAELWYAYNITGGSGHTVTVAYVTGAGAAFIAVEYSGLLTTDPLDKVSGAAFDSAVFYSSNGTANTTQADELLVSTCVMGSFSYTLTPLTGDTEFAAKQDTFNGGWVHALDHTVAAAGVYASAGNLSGVSSNSTVIATFKIAGASGSPLSQPSLLAGLGAGGPFFRNPLG